MNLPRDILFWSVEVHMFSCLMDTTDVDSYTLIGAGVESTMDTLISILFILMLADLD